MFIMLAKIMSLPWPSLLTGAISILTGVHVIAIFVGKWWPFALKIASFTGAFGVDLQKILGWLGGAPVYTSVEAKKMGKKMVDDAKTAVVAALLAIFFLIGCAPAQSAADVKAACTAWEVVGPIAAMISELVDITGLPATEIVAGIDAFCQANGTAATEAKLGDMLKMARAAKAKATVKP